MQITGFNSSFNMALMVGLRTYQQSSKAAARAMEHLATGKRINRVSDDPAGAAAAENLARDAVDLNARLKDAERSKAVLGTADGGMSVVSDLLQELNALVVSAASTGGSTQDERKGYQEQAESILTAIDFVVHNTVFDRKQILSDGFTVAVPDGSYGFGGMSLKSLGATWWSGGGATAAPSGARTTDERSRGPDSPGVDLPDRPKPAPQTPVSLEDLRGVLNLVNGDTETAQRVVQGAMDFVNGARADFGKTMQFDLGSRLNITRAQLEGVTSEYSRIVDADYAVEVSALVRAQILQQVSMASLQTIFQSQAQSTFGLLGGR